LNKLPALKSFLQNGEAEGYHGITLEFIAGMEPTLTIYNKDQEKEELINLRPYDTNAALHELMMSQGFVLRSPEERDQIRLKSMQSRHRRQLLENRVRTRIYYEKEKYYVEQFQKDVMGGLLESSIRGGRGGRYYLNENYRLIKTVEYNEYTGNRLFTTSPED
jgi:Sep15/SelM redox domain